MDDLMGFQEMNDERTAALEAQNARLRREIARLSREVERLSVYQDMAYLDHLTGLRNRRYFEERLAQELSRSDRQGSPCSLVLVDVDDFKRINDTNGHGVGDRVLRWVGRLLESNQRSMDVVCRVGGDEFCVILPATDIAGAEKLRTRLEQAQTEMVGLGDVPEGLTVTLSFGISTYPDQATTDDLLLHSADRAMYANKRARKSSSELQRAVDRAA